ncbi:tRNA (adenosine(37)-N6)-threonylcarbamoyltransferase complex ATPase subunit type 1 TsaE, partial [Candidatus Saccharibacteria bacterium]|nr:tRNA (adenosine(37)-N6)-threonylcarbamoyltransferase complex ATPase subunit type 1 TsaE [Candidatus Saccharibacteria bacterium]MBQ5812401.1 tRNA (adenosine(37)-N6)-threonylcarbamoyltransferase complex ATPase subunit type 1 TsaE [Candidatus Saccharibacteria bacterium]
MIINSEQEMLNFGADFAKRLVSTGDLAGRTVVELLGDVGAGKTTFTRGLAYGLGVKEPITSPSFTISKSYALPHSNGRLIHYDFYRLPDPGLMLDDLQENLDNPENIIIVEWGESVANILPENRIR